MQKSESIANLAKALCNVQSVLRGAKKDSDNPYFGSKYADLEAVWEACRKPLADNGLAVVQMPLNVPSGVQVLASGQNAQPDMIGLETLLMHESGEFISNAVYVRPSKMDAQAAGSVITYLRRYCLQSLVGICPEDDDAEGSMDRSAKQTSANTTQTKATAKPDAKPAAKPAAKIEAIEPSVVDMYIDLRDKTCEKLGKSQEWFKDQWKAAAKDAGIAPDPKKMTADQYVKVAESLTALLLVTQHDKLAPPPADDFPMFEGEGK